MIAFLLQALGLLLAVAFFGVIAFVGFSMNRRNRDLMKNGVRVPSTIVAVRPISVDNSYAFEPTVRYELHGRVWDSVPFEGRHALTTGTVFNTHRSGEQFIGTPLPVVVDQRDPRISAVSKTSRLGTVLCIVGLVFGGLILLFGTLGILIAGFAQL